MGLHASLMVAAGSVLWGWLWPFGDKAAVDDSPTVASIYANSPQYEAGEAVTADLDMVIEQYRLFIELEAGDPAQQVEAMRRLADLNLAVAEAMLADQTGDAAAAAKLAEAVDVYERLLHLAPDYANRDQVLYQLARAADAAGNSARAESALEALAARDPDSPLNAEAWFRRGEALFARADYANAAAAYRSVLAREPEGRFADQARYKLGWAHFKRGLHDESAESFVALLDRLIPADGADPAQVLANASRAEREIFEDVLRALAIGFSYDTGHEAITSLANSHGEPAYLWLLYSRLGDLYLEKERYLDAAQAYRAFAAIRPQHVRAPILHVAATEALTDGGFGDQALESRREYIASYGFDTDFWEGRDRTDLPEVSDRLRANLGLLAEHDHALAQSGIDPRATERAMRWYRKFVDYFPEDPQTPERHFMLGELLFEAGRFTDAIEAYQTVAYAYPDNARAPEAAWAAIVTGQSHAEELSDAAAREWLLATIEHRLQFARSFPLHPEADAALVSASEDLFATGSLPAAADVADEALMRGLNESLAVVALRVAGHARFDLADYGGAETAYTRLLGASVLEPSERSVLEERIAASVYRQAEALAAAGDRQAAVESFLRVGNAAPGSEVVPVAMHDAAALLIGQEEWASAIPILRDLRAGFPDHELARDVGIRLALALESLGDHTSAAGEYEGLAADDSRDAEMRRAALAKSVDLYETAGESKLSRNVAQRYVEEWPQPFDDALEMRQRLADWARDRQDIERRRHWMTEIVAADARAGAKRTDRSRFLAAHAALELAGPLVDSFAVARLVIPLEDSLKIKRARMELALGALGNAAAYGVADVSTAATLATAEIYAGLAQALLDSERPGELGEVELEEYQFLLEEQAYPFEEKAIEIFEINARRAAEGIFDDSVRASFARLRELVPGRYNREERHEVFIANLD